MARPAGIKAKQTDHSSAARDIRVNSPPESTESVKQTRNIPAKAQSVLDTIMPRADMIVQHQANIRQIARFVKSRIPEETPNSITRYVPKKSKLPMVEKKMVSCPFFIP